MRSSTKWHETPHSSVPRGWPRCSRPTPRKSGSGAGGSSRQPIRPARSAARGCGSRRERTPPGPPGRARRARPPRRARARPPAASPCASATRSTRCSSAGPRVRLRGHHGHHLAAPLHEPRERPCRGALALGHENDPHATSSSYRLERALGHAAPGVGTRGRRPGALAQLRPRRRVGQQLADRRAERLGVLRRHEPPGAVLLHHLPEAPHVGEHHRLPEGQPGEEHPGHVHTPVGQDEQVGAAEERGQLASLT